MFRGFKTVRILSGKNFFVHQAQYLKLSDSFGSFLIYMIFIYIAD